MALAAKVEGPPRRKGELPARPAAHLEAVHGAVLEHLAEGGAGALPDDPRRSRPHGRRSDQRDGVGARRPRRRAWRDAPAHGRLVAPEEACPSWRALYLRLGAFEAELMDHIHLENNVLFRRVLAA